MRRGKEKDMTVATYIIGNVHRLTCQELAVCLMCIPISYIVLHIGCVQMPCWVPANIATQLLDQWNLKAACREAPKDENRLALPE